MQGWDVSTMPRLSEGGQKHAGVGHLHPRWAVPLSRPS